MQGKIEINEHFLSLLRCELIDHPFIVHRVEKTTEWCEWKNNDHLYAKTTEREFTISKRDALLGLQFEFVLIRGLFLLWSRIRIRWNGRWDSSVASFYVPLLKVYAFYIRYERWLRVVHLKMCIRLKIFQNFSSSELLNFTYLRLNFSEKGGASILANSGVTSSRRMRRTDESGELKKHTINNRCRDHKVSVVFVWM